MKANKKLKIVFIFTDLIIALSVINAGFSHGQIIPEEPLKGREIFVSKGCVKCHSVHGEGGRIGSDLGKGSRGYNLVQIAGMMWNHAPMMYKKMNTMKIPWPYFKGEEMASLIAYLYYIDYFDEPGDAKEGERVFKNKGCSRCHNIGSKEGKVGPDLGKMKRYMSPIFLAQQMWNHGLEMEKKMEWLGIKFPEFQGKEIIDLMSYIRKASKESVEEKIYMVPGNPAEGEKIFKSKNCNFCHGENAVRPVGPDLRKRVIHGSVT
ncbi:MAG: c-type cytochrome, partial [Fidelibacterota bacterium]